ncbi:MAG: DUF3267 domain-containing protein [Chloroflexi bacterium]|nr:MAG: DUF3267 domain-containing protein [Chloroflexota bacterium]
METCGNPPGGQAITVPWSIELTNSSTWSGGVGYFGERYIAPILVDSKREPDWTFRLTSGVAARLIPLSLLLFVAAVAGYGALLPKQAPLPSLFTIVLVVVAVLLLHEALHGLGFVVYGGRPKFGFMVRGGVPYAYATCPGRLFSKRQYCVIGALPLVVISLASFALLPIPQAAVDGLVAFGFNTASAVGDLCLPEGHRGERPHGLDPRGFEWVVVWLVATLLSFGAVSVAELELTIRLNGGAGGRLMLGPVQLAEAGHTGGRLHGGFEIVPALLIAGLVGIGLTAAWRAIGAWRRRSV